MGGSLTMVAGDQSDQKTVWIAKAKNLGVVDNIETMELVGFWGDMISHFVKNGSDFKEESVVVAKAVKVAGFLEKASAEVGDMASMSHVAAKFFGS